MLYATLSDLLLICLAILTIGVAGVTIAFLFGFFRTNLRATKKNEWEFNYSLRAKELPFEGLPISKQKAIYLPSLTACTLCVSAMLFAFDWLVVHPNAQAIYGCYLKLFRSSYTESALKATNRTTWFLLFTVAIAMGFAMRFGRRLRTRMLQKKNMKQGYVVPVRSRGLLIYPTCFICTFAEAVCDKASKKFKRALVAARR